jgi:hypothetical protein
MFIDAFSQTTLENTVSMAQPPPHFERNDR